MNIIPVITDTFVRMNVSGQFIYEFKKRFEELKIKPLIIYF